MLRTPLLGVFFSLFCGTPLLNPSFLEMFKHAGLFVVLSILHCYAAAQDNESETIPGAQEKHQLNEDGEGMKNSNIRPVSHSCLFC
jgi:hypothetical protein